MRQLSKEAQSFMAELKLDEMMKTSKDLQELKQKVNEDREYRKTYKQTEEKIRKELDEFLRKKKADQLEA